MTRSNPPTLPPVLWLTGLSGAGKTTLARAVQQQLRARGEACEVLDGDEVRAEFWPELGFSEGDRAANIARLGALAARFRAQGVTVLVAAIAPYRHARQEVIARLDALEVWVDAPLDVLERRDPKGLYARARSGELPNFTGVSAPYEPPTAPALHLQTDQTGIEDCTAQLLRLLDAHT
ncbi:adenylyl-sulfate kinase [Deinococcus lacus]|uniref:Adenylyl-sulfate kinase n=1 Tax=Deinococcus lacus TaxID=392561 RepID=A0ABW1YGT6_9DEIO